jgi:hypothetical protein
VDRIEGDKAVLLIGEEKRGSIVLPTSCLPDGAGEGAVVTITVRYEPELTQKAAEEAGELIERLKDR